MPSHHSDSKRLAKNTMLLYMRTFLIMIISLFTSRIILNVLGVEDYGIYDIVGGFVSMFSIISGTLVATTQRYLNIEFGKDNGDPKKYFGIAMNIHFVLAIILFLLLESFGLWFLNTNLQIPGDRIIAANWVFQCSILSFLISLVATPYNAVIVAHERMNVYAYFSLIEVVLKLIIVYALYFSNHDRLIVYALLLLCVSVISPSFYLWYCRCHFSEARYTMVRDKKAYMEMFNFAGMNFIGSFASILANQGMNVLLNIFFGVTINAARGIANQVLGAASKFVSDFMVALNPQITKEYGAGNIFRSRDLCFRGSRFSFFLMLIFAIPISFKAPYILEIWLKNYPEYAVEFVRYSFILSLCTLLSNTLITEILATGNLTTTTFWIGGVRLMTLPIAYVVFKNNLGPEYAYIVLIGIESISLFVRLRILEIISNIRFVLPFIKNVLIRVIIVSFLLSLTNLFLSKMIVDTFLGLMTYISLSVIISTIFVILIGISKDERIALRTIIQTKFFNKK